jgi:adenosyl cobinamide kinase/adenosyl cobinamide phosphate guanylyltransferase
LPVARGWEVTRSDESESAEKLYFQHADGKTKHDAIYFATSAAIDLMLHDRTAHVEIYKRDGTIQSEKTYGNDPRRTEG